MSILSFMVLVGALALVWLGRKLAWALWQAQVRLARLEQSLANMAAAEGE
jgi:hypothetical protein